jgi:cysteine desulfurase/selenocysteine lyase
MPSKPTRIYLDNAATSWPKPESVYSAVDRYQRQVGVAAGRGSYRDAEAVERTIAQTRLNVCNLIGGVSSERIVFTQNCTDALNLALHGLLRTGDHVVTSCAEHNSILRPLEALRESQGISYTTVNVDSLGRIDVQALQDAVIPKTRLIALTHASNVTGFVQPIEQIGQLARDHGCLFLLDAAQTLGHVPIDVSNSFVDLLAAPGHKGLLGPLGTGTLYVGEGVEEYLQATRQGGTGTQSELPRQPTSLPAKYEAGNLNVPGIVGLAAGVSHVSKQGLGNRHVLDLTSRILTGFQVANVTLNSTPNDCGIVSFNIKGYDPREVATLLDSSAGIQVRAGLHCAPLMHQALGTYDLGGTIRASCGHFSTEQEIDKLVESVRMLAETPI